MELSAKLVVVFALFCSGCSDVSKTLYDDVSTDVGTTSFDGQILMDAEPNMRDADVAPTPFPDAGMINDDMAMTEPDAATEIDMATSPAVDCDPREQSAACEQGYYCVPSSEYEGQCEPGTACDVLSNDGCMPPDGTYCHLIGRTTVCTEEGVGIAGDDCSDVTNGAQPCAAGFACNGSICVEVCDPSSAVPCENQGRCADISASVGQNLGLCVERNCNIYSGAGCPGRQVCRFAVATDGVNVGSCRPPPPQPKADGERCVYGADDDCEQGFACVQAPTGDVCRRLCDSGGYEVVCPSGQACQEALENDAGTIRGIGICATNQ